MRHRDHVRDGDVLGAQHRSQATRILAEGQLHGRPRKIHPGQCGLVEPPGRTGVDLQERRPIVEPPELHVDQTVEIEVLDQLGRQPRQGGVSADDPMAAVLGPGHGGQRAPASGQDVDAGLRPGQIRHHHQRGDGRTGRFRLGHRATHHVDTHQRADRAEQVRQIRSGAAQETHAVGADPNGGLEDQRMTGGPEMVQVLDRGLEFRAGADCPPRRNQFTTAQRPIGGGLVGQEVHHPT